MSAPANAASGLATGAGQTYLVGEEIYLRPVVPADAGYGSAWQETVFPLSPERVKSWIEDDLAKSSNPYRGMTLVIVRRSDDRPIGAVTTDYQSFPHHGVTVRVDPLLGERGLVYQGRGAGAGAAVDRRRAAAPQGGPAGAG